MHLSNNSSWLLVSQADMNVLHLVRCNNTPEHEGLLGDTLKHILYRKSGAD